MQKTGHKWINPSNILEMIQNHEKLRQEFIAQKETIQKLEAEKHELMKKLEQHIKKITSLELQLLDLQQSMESIHLFVNNEAENVRQKSQRQTDGEEMVCILTESFTHLGEKLFESLKTIGIVDVKLNSTKSSDANLLRQNQVELAFLQNRLCESETMNEELRKHVLGVKDWVKQELFNALKEFLHETKGDKGAEKILEALDTEALFGAGTSK